MKNLLLVFVLLLSTRCLAQQDGPEYFALTESVIQKMSNLLDTVITIEPEDQEVHDNLKTGQYYAALVIPAAPSTNPPYIYWLDRNNCAVGLKKISVRPKTYASLRKFCSGKQYQASTQSYKAAKSKDPKAISKAVSEVKEATKGLSQSEALAYEKFIGALVMEFEPDDPDLKKYVVSYAGFDPTPIRPLHLPGRDFRTASTFNGPDYNIGGIYLPTDYQINLPMSAGFFNPQYTTGSEFVLGSHIGLNDFSAVAGANSTRNWRTYSAADSDVGFWIQSSRSPVLGQAWPQDDTANLVKPNGASANVQDIAVQAYLLGLQGQKPNLMWSPRDLRLGMLPKFELKSWLNSVLQPQDSTSYRNTLGLFSNNLIFSLKPSSLPFASMGYRF